MVALTALKLLMTTTPVDTRAICSTTGVAKGSLGKATHFINVNNTVKTLKNSVSAVKAGPTNVNVCHDGSFVASFNFSSCKARDGCLKSGFGSSGVRNSFSGLKFMFTSGVNGRASLHCIGFKFGCRGTGSFCGGVGVGKKLNGDSRACRVTRRTDNVAG